MSCCSAPCDCYEIFLQEHFCDAVLKVEGVEFNVNKGFLCNISEYFRALFLRWSTPDKTMFIIPGLSPGMMRLILIFARTGSVPLTEENVEELLLAADQFNVMGLIEICRSFLEERLTPYNCLRVWRISLKVSDVALRHKAFDLILENFYDVVFSPEFQLLSKEEASLLIDENELNEAHKRSPNMMWHFWEQQIIKEKRN